MICFPPRLAGYQRPVLPSDQGCSAPINDQSSRVENGYRLLWFSFLEGEFSTFHFVALVTGWFPRYEASRIGPAPQGLGHGSARWRVSGPLACYEGHEAQGPGPISPFRVAPGKLLKAIAL